MELYLNIYVEEDKCTIKSFNDVYEASDHYNEIMDNSQSIKDLNMNVLVKIKNISNFKLDIFQETNLSDSDIVGDENVEILMKYFSDYHY